MLEPGEPFVSEYTLDAEPFGYEPELFTVKVLRRSEDLWSVTRFGHQYWWNGSDFDSKPYDENVPIEEWWAAHRWPLNEALEQAKVAIRSLVINGMTYYDYLDWVEQRNNGMTFETWRNNRKEERAD